MLFAKRIGSLGAQNRLATVILGNPKKITGRGETNFSGWF